MVINILLWMFGKEQMFLRKISALRLTQSVSPSPLTPSPSPSGRGGLFGFIALISGVHTAVGAQGTLEAVHDEQDLLRLHGFEQRVHLGALSLWRFNTEVFESLFDEVLETGVTFVEGPPEEFGPFGGVDVCVNPLPGEGAFTKSAQGPEDEETIGRVRKPVVEHLLFGVPACEVGRHGVGVCEMPRIWFGFCDLNSFYFFIE